MDGDDGTDEGNTALHGIARAPSTAPGAGEFKWPEEAWLLYSSDGAITLQPQSKAVKNVFTTALDLVHIFILVSEPWPEQTSPVALAQNYFILATKALKLDLETDNLCWHIHEDRKWSQALANLVSSIFVSTYCSVALILPSL